MKLPKKTTFRRKNYGFGPGMSGNCEKYSLKIKLAFIRKLVCLQKFKTFGFKVIH